MRRVYYFYFIDRELGLCYLRVPTWPPFRLQFYMNGHNLAHKLDKKQIRYRMLDNAFLEISDIETAQRLSDRINPEELLKVLDVFARRYSPVPDSLGLGYTWTVQQIECATTDVMFLKPEYLEPLYDELIRTAIFTVKPDNIATFLGQHITYSCIKEIGTNYNQRILGTRIKHHMGDVSKCMISLAVFYGSNAPATISAPSVWNGKWTIGMVTAVSRKRP